MNLGSRLGRYLGTYIGSRPLGAAGGGSFSPLSNPFPTLDSQSWTPLQIESCRAIFAPAFERYAFQELATSDVCETHADAATELLGTFVDFSVGAFIWEATDATRRPTLRDSSNKRYAEFDGSNDVVLLNNSTSLFEDMFSNERGTVAVRFRVPSGQDSNTLNVIDGINGSGVNPGFLLQKVNNGTIRVNFADGGNNFVQTTGTVANADGFVTVVVRWDSGGVAINIDSSEETFSAVGAISASITTEIALANREAGNAAERLDIEWVAICTERVSDAERDELVSWTPDANTDRMIFARTDAQGFASCLNRFYDFLDETTFDDGAGGTPAVGAGVDSVMHKVDSALGRAAQAASAGVRPLRRAAGVEWDGTDDNFDIQDVNLNLPCTLIAVVDNDDDTTGSHILVANGNRLLVTGEDYSGNAAQRGVAYSLIHPAIGSTNSVDLVSETGWNIIEIKRDGPNWEHSVTGRNKTPSTSSETCRFVDMGDEQPGGAFSGWELDGRVSALLHFHEYLTDDELAYVRQQLIAALAVIGETVPTT